MIDKEHILIIGNKLHTTLLKNMAETDVFKKKEKEERKEAVLDILDRSSIFRLSYSILRIIDRIRKKKYSIIHIIYPSHRLSLWIAKNALKKNIKVILHWIGSDILLAERRSYFYSLKSVFEKSIHVADAPWLSKELRKYGIEPSGEIPLIPFDMWQLANQEQLPYSGINIEGFSYLYYLPKGKEKLYNYEALVEIAKAFPETMFYVVGTNSVTGDITRNIRPLGIIPRNEMLHIYKKTIGLIRLPVHDGLSIMVMEALLFNRYVIYNHPLENPCLYYVSDIEEAISTISKINAIVKKYGHIESSQCREALLSSFSPEVISASLYNLWFL